jgi:hypothetical protein
MAINRTAGTHPSGQQADGNLSGKPIYCKNCNSRESWQRFPIEDIWTESGKAFEFCFKCTVCGSKTWYPPELVRWVRTSTAVGSRVIPPAGGGSSPPLPGHL